MYHTLSNNWGGEQGPARNSTNCHFPCISSDVGTQKGHLKVTLSLWSSELDHQIPNCSKLSKHQLNHKESQPNITKLGFYMEMTVDHHPPTITHHKNSMSALFQLLLTRFSPNFNPIRPGGAQSARILFIL